MNKQLTKQPEWWLSSYPPYHSKEGWELEKQLALKKLKEKFKR